MAPGDARIRLSRRVKRALERRRRTGDSYDDVLGRLLEVESSSGDFEDGFDRWSADETDRVRSIRENGREVRKRRVQRRDSVRRRVVHLYFEDEIGFDTVEKILGTDAARGHRLQKEDLARPPLDIRLLGDSPQTDLDARDDRDE